LTKIDGLFGVCVVVCFIAFALVECHFRQQLPAVFLPVILTDKYGSENY